MARPTKLRTCSAIKCTQDYIKFIRIRKTGRGRQASRQDVRLNKMQIDRQNINQKGSKRRT